ATNIADDIGNLYAVEISRLRLISHQHLRHDEIPPLTSECIQLNKSEIVACLKDFHRDDRKLSSIQVSLLQSKSGAISNDSISQPDNRKWPLSGWKLIL
ncbi:MAG: hypothetical protein AAF892_10965, partial [Cyanobacteria bacterium P01_D01_bin.71]